MAQYCGHCGQQNPDEGLYCTRCGAALKRARAGEQTVQIHQPPVSPPPETGNGRGRGRRLLIAAIALLLAVVLGAGSMLLVNASGNRRFDRKLQQIRDYGIPEFTSRTERLERRWSDTGPLSLGQRREILQDLDELAAQASDADQSLRRYSADVSQRLEEADRLDIDGSADEYRTSLEQWQDAIGQKDYALARTQEANVTQAYEETIRKNNEYCEKKKAVFAAADLSDAPADVADTMSDRLREIDELQQAQKYDQLLTVMAALEEEMAMYLEPARRLDISVQQVDVKSFPEMKVYVNILDESGSVPHDLDRSFFYIDKADANGQYVRQKVAQVTQLDEVETLNIDMVVDVSGSMEGNPIMEVRGVMEDFIRSVQFEAGDMVELTAFDTDVHILQEFCNDEDTLIQYARSLTTGDLTSLYDALYTAVNRVASRSDAKCVMAFTDGRDNDSSFTAGQVAELAGRYHVPIFIIGFGDVDTAALRSICDQTNGAYYDAGAISDMGEIYQRIYRQEKELYLLSYRDEENAEPPESCDLAVGYRSAEYGGDCSYSFKPSVVIDVDDDTFYQTGPKAVVEKYVKGYAKAQTHSDFSYIEPYLKPGSTIYNDMKTFVTETFSVYLDSFEIVGEEYTDSSNCLVTVYETYYVQTKSRPLYLMTQKCKYCVECVGGTWYLTKFAEPVEVLWEVNQ